jgi:WD40 repeat protein
VDDSQRLLLEYFDIIQNSPSQIYYSLPFSPPSSWLHKYYGAELSGVVKVVKGLPAEWGTCSRTVRLASIPVALACWKDTIAVGLNYGSIIILNAITGSHTSVLSGHINWVGSLAFSPDGTSLVSGSLDTTLKLWDVQTGGIVKTFHGHTGLVCSVSISADCAMIASGSMDMTIRLWEIQTGGCHYVVEKQGWCSAVFSPTDPKHLIFGNAAHGWDIEGYKVGYTDGFCAAFSSDGTHFISHDPNFAIAQNSVSRAAVAKCEIPNPIHSISCSCLSPNGSLVAAAAKLDVYIWDITGSDPLLIQTIPAHTMKITSLTFSSPTTLISASWDQSVKFWQIGIPTNPAAGDPQSILFPLVPVKSVSLQAENGIAISGDRDGVVRVWDISTGHCKASFQTPARNALYGDAQMIDGRLIFAWIWSESINIWDTSGGRLFHSVDGIRVAYRGLRISGDGSKIFYLAGDRLQAWSTQTGEVVNRMDWGCSFLDPLCMGGSKIWVNYRYKQAQGWDFGVSGSSPVLLSSTSSERPRLHFICGFGAPSRIEDTVTRKEVFWLSGRHAKPGDVRWDGQYLVAGYGSGEVLILNFKHLCSE